MGSPNSQVSHIGTILATTINVSSTVARRNTNSATKDELKGKEVNNMFGDLLSSRMIQAGLVFFLLVVGGSLLYSWHVHRTTDAEFPRPDAVQVNDREAARDTREIRSGDFEQAAPELDAEDTPTVSDDTAVPSTNETAAETIDSTDTIQTDAVSADALDPSKMSRFGLGPYPEIPKEWNFLPNSWETDDTIEEELLTRVAIKMHNEGTRSKYGSVGVSPTGQVIALERGSVLVEYEIDENGEKSIYSALAHPDDLSQGIYTRESQIPSDLKIVTADEIAFDAYEYLGLPK